MAVVVTEIAKEDGMMDHLLLRTLTVAHLQGVSLLPFLRVPILTRHLLNREHQCPVAVVMRRLNNLQEDMED